MQEDEDQGQAHGGADGGGGGDAPGEPGQELEGGEEVSEGGVGEVIGVFGFCCRRRELFSRWASGILRGGGEREEGEGELRFCGIFVLAKEGGEKGKGGGKKKRKGVSRGSISIGTPSLARLSGASSPRWPFRSPSAGI